MISIRNAGPESLRLGVVTASGLSSNRSPDGFEFELKTLLAERARGLSLAQDAWRQAVRDILRNGTYKPTGRGKPASEYLIRVASEGSFPRINSIVDICNFVSLWSLLPISIWDLDRAGTTEFVVRLGKDEESYIFNSAGHEIGLKDLVVGCSLLPQNPEGQPIVNPVKDSMGTKTEAATNSIAALLYSPVVDGPMGTLETVCEKFSSLLASTGDGAAGRSGVVASGAVVQI